MKGLYYKGILCVFVVVVVVVVVFTLKTVIGLLRWLKWPGLDCGSQAAISAVVYYPGPQLLFFSTKYVKLT